MAERKWSARISEAINRHLSSGATNHPEALPQFQIKILATGIILQTEGIA